MEVPTNPAELERFFLGVEHVLSQWERTVEQAEDAYARHEITLRKAEQILRVLNATTGVPAPPEGMQWYLVEAGANAGTCVFCAKVLEHPYYTMNMHGSPPQPSEPHPPILFLSKDGEGLPGRADLWTEDAVSPADGFAYESSYGMAWTGWDT